MAGGEEEGGRGYTRRRKGERFLVGVYGVVGIFTVCKVVFSYSVRA